MAQFKDLLALPALHSFVEDSGFKRPTAVQTASIPRLLGGDSISVLAQTGSGKTLAYALPIAEMLKKLEASAGDAEPATGTPRAWIMCPTRELGMQIEKVFKGIAHHAKLRVRHLKGGDTQKQARALAAGPIDVLIGSPQRALRAVQNGQLKADAARFLIFDEADQLLDRGFMPDVKGLVSLLNSHELQVGLFSATMPPIFAELRKEAFPGIEFGDLTLQGSHTLQDNISTNNYTVPFKEKPAQTIRLVTKAQGPGFLFVNQKSTAEIVARKLMEALPYKQIHLLHGGMEKRDRRKVLKRFSDGGDFLVCTDVAARGLDLPGLSWVLNYDLPYEAVYYVHRCGRVGRRGEPAQVYNLVTLKDRPLITRINTAIANQSSLKLSRVSERREPSGKQSVAGKGKGKGDDKRVGRKVSTASRGSAKGRPSARPTTSRAKAAGGVVAGRQATRAKPASRASAGKKKAGRAAAPGRKPSSRSRPKGR